QRQRLAHRPHDARHVGLAGDGQHLRVTLHDLLGPLAEAAGDYHLARLPEGLTDGVERLLDRGRDEPAGVHDHELGVLVAADELVAVGPEVAEDALAVHQRLGATERDEAHLGALARRPALRDRVYRLHAAGESSRGLNLPARYREPATTMRPPSGVRSRARRSAAAGSPATTRPGPARCSAPSPGEASVTTTAAAYGSSARQVAAPCFLGRAPVIGGTPWPASAARRAAAAGSCAPSSSTSRASTMKRSPRPGRGGAARAEATAAAGTSRSSSARAARRSFAARVLSPGDNGSTSCSGAPTWAATARATCSAGPRAAVTAGTPGANAPAFSRAMSSTVDPRVSTWSRSTLVSTTSLTRPGLAAAVVASLAPPTPASRTAHPAPRRANVSSASARASSKKAGRASSSGR